jgi:hypothetical protein
MKSNLQRFLTLFALGFQAFSFVGWWWMNELPMNETFILLFASLLLCVWTPLSILTLLWLLWVGRRILEHSLVWVCFQLLFFILLFGTQLPFPFLSSLAGVYFLVFAPILLVVNFVYARRHHLALHFLGVGSLVLVWSIVIAGRVQGDLLQIFLDSMEKMSNPLLWLNGIMFSMTILMLAGFAALFVDGLHLLLNEGQSPSAMQVQKSASSQNV